MHTHAVGGGGRISPLAFHSLALGVGEEFQDSVRLKNKVIYLFDTWPIHYLQFFFGGGSPKTPSKQPREILSEPAHH